MWRQPFWGGLQDRERANPRYLLGLSPEYPSRLHGPVIGQAPHLLTHLGASPGPDPLQARPTLRRPDPS